MTLLWGAPAAVAAMDFLMRLLLRTRPADRAHDGDLSVSAAWGDAAPGGFLDTDIPIRFVTAEKPDKGPDLVKRQPLSAAIQIAYMGADRGSPTDADAPT